MERMNAVSTSGSRAKSDCSTHRPMMWAMRARLAAPLGAVSALCAAKITRAECVGVAGPEPPCAGVPTTEAAMDAEVNKDLNSDIERISAEITRWFVDQADSNPAARAAVWCAQPMDGLSPQGVYQMLTFDAAVLLPNAELLLSTEHEVAQEHTPKQPFELTDVDYPLGVRVPAVRVPALRALEGFE